MARPKDPALHGRLLAAAAEEFAASGFEKTSMAAVGQRAGVTKGGVYFHFRSKEQLFFAALDGWRGRLRQVFEAIPARPSAAERLTALLGAYLEVHFRHPAEARLLRMLGTELRGRFTVEVRDDLRSVFRALRAQLRELLVDGERDGSLYAQDPAAAAFLLAAACEGVVQQWLGSERDVEAFCHPETLADALVAPYATGVAARPAPGEDVGGGGKSGVPPF